MIDRSVELLYPTPLHIVDFENVDFCKTAANHVKQIQTNGECVGDHLCVTTPDDLHTRPEFSELCNILRNEIELVFDSIGLIREDHYFTCMWANISKAENRHSLHLHANSFYSGVIYLSAPGDDPGNIGFKDPRWGSELLSFDYTEKSIFKSRTLEVRPRLGRLIMFPSWFHHGTKPGRFDNSEDRIALSFNVMPHCHIQDYTRKLVL